MTAYHNNHSFYDWNRRELLISFVYRIGKRDTSQPPTRLDRLLNNCTPVPCLVIWYVRSRAQSSSNTVLKLIGLAWVIYPNVWKASELFKQLLQIFVLIFEEKKVFGFIPSPLTLMLHVKPCSPRKKSTPRQQIHVSDF